jgi:ankyrin repeat protein
VGGHVDVARFLVENGADVNAKNNDDDTPLHGAALNGYVDVARFLVENGADVNAKDKNGKTPIDIAREKGHNDIVKLLERAREEAVPHIELLGFEQDEIEAGKWGRLKIKLRANKPITVSVELSGDVDWLNPGVVKLSGESLIEVPVKPKIAGEIPAQVTLTYGDNKTSSITWIKAGGNSYQRCPKCNAQIEPEAKYCWRCGAKLA